ncbi:ABC transporter permease [Anoxynatronum sibiricum]|uniref:ABC transporter permease n=1 Tax=Anoxynatronum sibiricum TaxID=210623 RepID=A0ABU9VWW2_9CLOT
MNGASSALFVFWRRRIRTLAKRRWQFHQLSLDKTSLFYLVLMVTALWFYYGTSAVTGLVRSVPWHPWMEMLTGLILFWGLVAGSPATWLRLPDIVFLQPLKQKGRKFVTWSLLFGWGVAGLRWALLCLVITWLRWVFQQPGIPFLLLFIIGGWMVQWLWRMVQLWVRQRNGHWTRRWYRWIFRFLFYAAASFIMFRWLSPVWSIPSMAMGLAITGFITCFITWKVLVNSMNWHRLMEEETDLRSRKEAGLLGGMETGATGIITTQFPFKRTHPLLALSPVGGLLLRYSRRLVRRRREMQLLAQILLVYLAGILFLGDGKFTFVAIVLGMGVMSRYFQEQWDEDDDDPWMCHGVMSAQHWQQAKAVSLRLGLFLLFALPAVLGALLGQHFRHPVIDLMLLTAIGEGIVRYRRHRQ